MKSENTTSARKLEPKMAAINKHYPDFRVYADLWRGVKYMHVIVRVFHKRIDMQEDIDKWGFGPHGDCYGQCSGVEHYNKKGRVTGRFAYMWLNKEDLLSNGMEIICHESIHAAMRHVSNRNVDLSEMPGEEVLAYTAGNLAAQINIKLNKLKVFN